MIDVSGNERSCLRWVDEIEILRKRSSAVAERNRNRRRMIFMVADGDDVSLFIPIHIRGNGGDQSVECAIPNNRALKLAVTETAQDGRATIQIAGDHIHC